MKRRSRSVALAAVAAGLVVAGCGGDDDETTVAEGASGATGASSAPIALGSWIDQADAVCAEEGAAIDEAANEQFGSSGGQPDDAAVADFAEQTVIPSLQAQHDTISALPPPEGEEDQAQALLDSLATAIDEVEQDPAAVSASGPDSPFAEANALAKELGLRECGGD